MPANHPPDILSKSFLFPVAHLSPLYYSMEVSSRPSLAPRGFFPFFFPGNPQCAVAP